MDKIEFQNGKTKANAETMNAFQDNIEEAINELKPVQGTWTPTLMNATVTYKAREGNYIKIGKCVFVEFSVRGDITAKGTTPYSQLSGLPFSNLNVSNCQASGSLSEWLNCLEVDSVMPAVTFLDKKVRIGKGGAAGGGEVNYWKIGTGFYLSGAGFYFTSE